MVAINRVSSAGGRRSVTLIWRKTIGRRQFRKGGLFSKTVPQKPEQTLSGSSTIVGQRRRRCRCSRSRLPGGTWRREGPARQAGPTCGLGMGEGDEAASLRVAAGDDPAVDVAEDRKSVG